MGFPAEQQEQQSQMQIALVQQRKPSWRPEVKKKHFPHFPQAGEKKTG